jgi:hypothetical protein
MVHLKKNISKKKKKIGILIFDIFINMKLFFFQFYDKTFSIEMFKKAFRVLC